MLFSILGPIELYIGDTAIDLGPAKQRAILSALLIDRGRPVPLDVLVTRVWGDTPPAEVRNLVYTYVARLRRKLSAVDTGPTAPAIKRVVGGYFLQTPPESVDLYRFHQLLARARRLAPDDPERGSLLSLAQSMWRGVPLAGIGGRWADGMRHRLQQLHYEALVEWADIEVRLGRPRTVIDALRQAYVESPTSESVATHLMYALHADGCSAEALQLFEQIRQHLATEIGTDPGSSLREAHREILRGRPSAPSGLAAVPALPEAHGSAHETFTAAAPFHAAAMLPMDLPDFTGRADEIATIRDTLTPGDKPLMPSVAVLYGPAGYGKTTIAIRTAYQLLPHYPSGQLFVDLEGDTPTPADPFEVLERFLRATGLTRTEIPDSFAGRAELFRARLAGSRTLLILDNAADEAQVAPLLPGTGYCAVIITHRARPAVPHSVPVVLVGSMAADESAAMLRSLVGERMDREPAAAERLLELCAGSPLMLRIVGCRLMMRQHWPVSRLLDRLLDDDRLLIELTDGQHNMRARISRTYGCLDPATQRFFLELADLPDDRLSVLSVAQALNESEFEVEEHIERLLDVHLLGPAVDADPEGSAFTLPKLHRLFAQSVHEPAGPKLDVVGL
ncbi:BTAD domain-containing putative transcriptional regulator [Nocardia salmonicida]|uniref:BTAD domain-containing putative transcriptional regulator n=1 Tax=Nocardia salmonicida TaxID=53431 RepID=UPI0033FD6293